MPASFTLATACWLGTLCAARPLAHARPYTTLSNLTFAHLGGKSVDATTRRPTDECSTYHVIAWKEKTESHAEWFRYIAEDPRHSSLTAIHAFLRAKAGGQTYEQSIMPFFFRVKDQSKPEKWILKHLLGQLTERKETHLGPLAKIVTGQSELLQGPSGEELVYFLLINNFIQSTSVDEYIYHEVLVHTALVASRAASADVFIGGGGEGATLREALRHHSVRSAVMVDIDGPLMDGFYAHLPYVHNSSFDDPRATVIAGDARAYLEQILNSRETARTFDAVLLDFPEFYTGDNCLRTLGGLFSWTFHLAAKSRLRPGGVLITQAPMYDECSALAALQSHYRYVRIAITPMLSYPANLFFVASDDVDPMNDLDAKEVDKRIEARIKGKLRWFSGAIFTRLWLLDGALRNACQRVSCILEDSKQGYMCTDDDSDDKKRGEL